jgi:hypothetical protein
LAALRRLGRLRTEQLNQAAPADRDLDAIASDVDPAKECHQHRSSLVRRHGRKLFCDLAATSDQPVLSSPISVSIANGIEDCSLIGKEGSQFADDEVLEIASRDPPSL